MAPPFAGLDLNEAGLISQSVISALNRQDGEPTQLFEKLVWFYLHGPQGRLRVTLAAQLGTEPGFVDDTGVVGSADNRGLQTITECRSMVQEIYVRMRVACAYSEIYDQLEIQVWAAVCRFVERLMKAVFSGAGGAEITGLDFIAPIQLTPIDTTNYFLCLEDLERLFSQIRCDGPVVAACSILGWKNILKVFFDNGIIPEIAFIEVWDDNGYLAMRPVLMFRGVPIFIDRVTDKYSIGAFADATRLYVFQLGRGGVYLITTSPDGQPRIHLCEALDEIESVLCCRMTWPIGMMLETPGGGGGGAAHLTFRAQAGTQ